MIDLFHRNFDIDAKRSVHKAATASAEAIADLKEQLERAHQQGFEAGRQAGRQEAIDAFDAAESERMIKEREAIQTQLEALVAIDANHKTETERDIVDLFSGIAERLVPELLETYGPALAIERIRQSLTQVRTDPVLRIKASPEVIAALQKETPDWLTPASQNTQIDLVADAEMNRGAAEVKWKGGRLNYDIHAACLAMLQALAVAAKDYDENAQKVG